MRGDAVLQLACCFLQGVLYGKKFGRGFAMIWLNFSAK